MTDNTLLYKIAKAYYEDALTQDQIGKRFGLSRIKVSRLLQQARQSRVVQITITPPADSFGDLERDLERAYGLDEVVVVAADSERTERCRAATGRCRGRLSGALPGRSAGAGLELGHDFAGHGRGACAAEPA